jgi:succinoglycan biosynthesis transport protein ExoP
VSRNYDLLRTIQPRSELRVKYNPPLRPVPPTPLPKPSAAPPSPNNYDWIWVLGVLRRRWQIGLAFTVIAVAVTAAASFLMTPTYIPESRIEVDPAGTEDFSLQTGTSELTDMDRIMETQTEIIKSDELAIKLIRALRLGTRPDVAGKFAGRASEPPAPETKSTDTLSRAEYAALHYVQANLRATAVKGSRVIAISFASHDARLSRDAVNTAVQLYLERNYESRYKSVAQSSEWLSRQLADIRQKADDSNRALAEYQRLHNITDIDSQQSTFAVKVSDLTQQLTQAQADRIQLEAYYNSIQAGEGSSLPQVRDNPVIQTLTKNLGETQTQLSQARVIYGKNHPNVQKLDNAAKELRDQLLQQQEQIVDGVKTSYLAAKAREDLMSRQLQSTTAGVNAMGEYSILKHEAQANTDLYNSLYGKIKEAGIAAASKSSNIRVIEPARLLDLPTTPKPLQNIAVAMVFGLVGGIVVAFLRDRFDTGIRRPEEIPQLDALPSVTYIPRIEAGMVPMIGGKPQALLPSGQAQDGSAKPFVITNPDCDGAEAIRTLVSSLLLGSSQTAPRVLLVVSGLAAEGKTTVAVNLAVALAELASTCIVDADLRRPSVGNSFGLLPGRGIAEVLNRESPLDAILRSYPGAPNLRIAPAGSALSNPGAVLMSAAMGDLVAHLRNRFEYVVIDSPPILGYADARALAPLADGVVVVARYAQTTRETVNRTMDILQQLHAPVLAFVLNEMDATQPGYYKYPNTGRYPNVSRIAQ